MTETHYRDIDCPYCRKSPSDKKYEEIDDYLEDDGDDIETECEYCSMFYKTELEIEISRNYTCYEIEPQPVKEKKFKDVEGQEFFTFYKKEEIDKVWADFAKSSSGTCLKDIPY